MSRLVIASNRVPITVSGNGDEYTLKPSAGGLATALRGVHDEGDSVWVGYVGEVGKLSAPARERLARELESRRLVSVPLSASDVTLYYDGFSNTVLWPLFHYLLDKVRLDPTNEWRAYRAVNERFAAAAVEQLRPGDSLWVHDYHLTLVPGLVRKKRPDVRIGFFLHVPWPAADVFRILPHREQILESLLACDVVGFHAEDYRHNFVYSAAKVLGIDIGVDTLSFQDRTVRVGVYPIGIDVQRFERESSTIDQAAQKIVAGTPGKRRMLGLDRLDYTKGIPRRLLAVARLLEREPTLRDKLHYIQLAVPTRERVDAYTKLRGSVNELVGRINSQFGSPTGSPVQLLYRSVGDDDLLALYRTADLMVVTPLRDGMNLVAKEYVASRTTDDGVLLLSEFAGAAAELDAALIVNPYDIGAVADAMRRGLFMSKEEQGVRMRRLRARVRQSPVDDWARSFVQDLATTEVVSPPAITPRTDLDTVVERFAGAVPRALLLDYDGTLVPIAPLPDLARPDGDLLALLGRLSRVADLEVHIVSGRARSDLEEWLAPLPLWLYAEHGFWRRAPGKDWVASAAPPPFLEEVTAILQRHARRTPGAFVEAKSGSVAFHYRATAPVLAETRVRALRAELTTTFGPRVDLLDGQKVLEVRSPGVNKSRVVESIVKAHEKRPLLLGIGDDRTDEDLFTALGPEDISIRVGPGSSAARFRIATPSDVREFLARLA